MIAKIIELSVRNKFMVLLLTAGLVIAGIWAALHSSIDAVPDLSDVQVIVITDYAGQAPQVVEDQVTYPLTTAMMGIAHTKAVRGISMFETSMIYIIFDEGTDLYWARSRVLEYLNFAKDRLPANVEPKLGPDATGVGWIYQYVLHPGYYCPDHPQGIYHDEAQDKWYAEPAQAPADRRGALVKVRAFDHAGVCPLSSKPLISSSQDLASLRSLQDWYLRYQLTSVPGVAEVASIGGFVKQYQIVLKPQKLLAYNLAVKDIMMAVQRSNNDVGGSVVEMSENEYMVRSRGYLHGLADLAKVPVGMSKSAGDATASAAAMSAAPQPSTGTPVYLSDVATLQIAGEERRGVGEWNGQGEAVGGVVIGRFGANAFQVIHDAKAKLAELESGLPPGVTIKTSYDRSDLIERSIHTLRHTLVEEMIVVGLVCILFLLHARSELVAIFVVPTSVLASLLIMHLMGINANIMSLGGIAIAIGVMVDSAIIMVENAHKHLDREEERVHLGESPRPRSQIIMEAAKEVGPSLFFSLLIITVSFVPVFVLGGESGRLFKPLAFTKTFSMAAASVLSITIIPVLMVYFITARVLPKEWGWKMNLLITLAAMFGPAAALWWLAQHEPVLYPYRWWLSVGWAVLLGMLLVPQKIIHEDRSPISHLLQKLYNPFFTAAIKFRWPVLLLATAFIASAIWPFRRLGSEFMPPLDEGDLLYMPTTDPSISVTKARQVLQQTDKLIKMFPEVTSVYGKIGRAETATDPAPLDMIESVARLQTDPGKWRKRTMSYFFDNWPAALRWSFEHSFWPHQRKITMEELVYGWQDKDGTEHTGLNAVVTLPGVANAWPMPIENRTNMLSTGIKTPVGIKIMGPDLQVLSDLAEKASTIALTVSGTTSAYPERSFGGYYLDIDIKRDQAARYGLTSGDVQDVISTALGGMKISTAVEGLERYPINLRYARDLRDDPDAIKQVLVPTPTGAQIPLGQLAKVAINPGPPMIKSENSRRTAWVFIDIAGRDIGSYIKDAQAAMARELQLPPGYTLVWSGQFENIQEANARLKWAVPLTLVIIIVLLYMATRSFFRVAVVLLAVPFSLVGAVWLLWLLGYHLSLAVWVGMIALAGLDAETGLVMLLYLDNSYERFKAEGRMRSKEDLWHAVHDGAVKRIRPKTMTVAAAFIGLVPLLWATGTGADVMRRLAAPMLGGLFTSFLMELLIYPIIFYVAKSIRLSPSPGTPGEGRGGSLSKLSPALVLALILVPLISGCTVHPPGEREERQAALDAGKSFTDPVPALPDNATPDQLVEHALLTNADLQQKFWEWRAAIEQIPQDGTQATNLAISTNIGFFNGSTGLDRTTLSAGNDPMADIVLPAKLSAAARRALENARAAGMRFRAAQFELRSKVLSAYYDYALTGALIRLEQSNAQLLQTTATVVEARNRAGAAGQQDLLKARNEIDLSANDIANMQAQLPAQRAALNALLGREPGAALDVPSELPTAAPKLKHTDEEILALAAAQNPQLGALARDVAARKQSIALARLQYVPDFSLAAGTDLKGVAQSLLGVVTIPALRHEAIDAAIAQAEANLHAAEEMRRQASHDLGAQVVMDIATIRDAERQLELFEQTILPRARQIVTVGRTAYESGRSSLLDVLDAQRSLISIERLVANLRVVRAKRLAELEAIIGQRLGGN
jgi:Cu(I)/Ag(I) efflux system membrane protein CusA/SilA